MILSVERLAPLSIFATADGNGRRQEQRYDWRSGD